MSSILAVLSAAARSGTSGALPAQMPPAAALPAQMPPAASVSGKSDKHIASSAAKHLLAAISRAHDPELKAQFSSALSSLHKYLAQDSKEQKQAATKASSKSVSEPKPKKK